MTSKRLLVTLSGALVLVAGLVLYRSVGWARYTGPANAIVLDLSRPDVLIRTRSLSSLPRDLLKVPIARDLLTEDFVFYYESHPDRLGLKGSLRRIAYEHQLQWRDEVLQWVFDQPAEIALWRAGDGTLKHWLMSMSRRDLAKVVQEAATVAMKDRQISLAGQLTVDGGSVDLYAFAYSARQTLLVASHGDRVVVLSDPGLLLNADNTPQAGAVTVVRSLLSSSVQQPPYAEAFRLSPEFAKHSVAVRAHFLSFGYQRFFPGLEALRFDFGDGRWATQALLDGTKLGPAALRDRELWAALPANPAGCALLPLDWQAGEAVLAGAPELEGKKLSALASEFEGPAAVCWYAQGHLHTPLFVVTLKRPGDDLTPLFDALFEWSMAGSAPSAEPDAVQPAADGGASKGAQAERGPGDQLVWKREMSVPFSAVDASGTPEPGTLTVTLARRGRYVFFSPDGERVRQALATLGKKYPSLSETLRAKAVTLVVLAPKALAEMAENEAMLMLPRVAEPVFRAAAKERLKPRLRAIKKYPAYRLALTGNIAAERRWYPVEWQEYGK